MYPKIKFNWQRSCLHFPLGFNIAWWGEVLKNFDQWMEELSKQALIQSDENDLKALIKENEILDDDFEEE
jgi:hypothetical protein